MSILFLKKSIGYKNKGHILNRYFQAVHKIVPPESFTNQGLLYARRLREKPIVCYCESLITQTRSTRHTICNESLKLSLWNEN
jgi:hypothetical protein